MIVVFRIDDRLIHAQVVIGWGSNIKPDRMVIADDDIAANEWERDLYMAAVSPDMKVSILTLSELFDQLSGGVFDQEKVMVLVKGPEEALRLVDMGLELDEINVGGMHYAEGKKKILDNVYLDESDRKYLRELVKKGITLEARALPEQEKVILNSKVV